MAGKYLLEDLVGGALEKKKLKTSKDIMFFAQRLIPDGNLHYRLSKEYAGEFSEISVQDIATYVEQAKKSILQLSKEKRGEKAGENYLSMDEAISLAADNGILETKKQKEDFARRLISGALNKRLTVLDRTTYIDKDIDFVVDIISASAPVYSAVKHSTEMRTEIEEEVQISEEFGLPSDYDMGDEDLRVSAAPGDSKFKLSEETEQRTKEEFEAAVAARAIEGVNSDLLPETLEVSAGPKAHIPKSREESKDPTPIILREELKQKRQGYIDYIKAQKDLADKSKQLEEEENRLKSVSSDVISLHHKMSREKTELDEEKQKLAAKGKKFAIKKKNNLSLIKQWEEKTEAAEAKVEEYRERVQELEAYKLQVTSVEQQLDTLRTTLKEQQDYTDELELANNELAKDDANDTLIDKIGQLEEELSKKDEDLQGYQDKIDELDSSLTEVTEKNQELVHSYGKEKKATGKKVIALQETLEEYISITEKTEKKYISMNEKIGVLTSEKQELEQELSKEDEDLKKYKTKAEKAAEKYRELSRTSSKEKNAIAQKVIALEEQLDKYTSEADRIEVLTSENQELTDKVKEYESGDTDSQNAEIKDQLKHTRTRLETAVTQLEDEKKSKLKLNQTNTQLKKSNEEKESEIQDLYVQMDENSGGGLLKKLSELQEDFNVQESKYKKLEKHNKELADGWNKEREKNMNYEREIRLNKGTPAFELDPDRLGALEKDLERVQVRGEIIYDGTKKKSKKSKPAPLPKKNIAGVALEETLVDVEELSPGDLSEAEMYELLPKFNIDETVEDFIQRTDDYVELQSFAKALSIPANIKIDMMRSEILLKLSDDIKSKKTEEFLQKKEEYSPYDPHVGRTVPTEVPPPVLEVTETTVAVSKEGKSKKRRKKGLRTD